MKRLTPNELVLVGAGNCGGTTSSIIIEGTMAAAGAFVGFGLSAGNPVGAYWGANIGFALGGLLCRS